MENTNDLLKLKLKVEAKINGSFFCLYARIMAGLMS